MRVKQVAAGGDFTCALTTTAKVYCWGENKDGQLGTGNGYSSSVPVQVTKLPKIKAITAGDSHACAIATTGAAYCWGRNHYGQLGTGTRIPAFAPVAVPGLEKVSTLSAGSDHTCATTGTGKLFCWGYNGSGQLGNGTTNDATTTTAVAGLEKVSTLAAGSSHTCAATPTGKPFCWGYNYMGQLGNGTYSFEDVNPTAVAGLDKVTTLTAGSSHTCAATPTGKPFCWGFNFFGQLGNGTTSEFATRFPVAVTGLDQVTSLSAGSNHTCAVTRAGKPFCWGTNAHGQLGKGTSGINNRGTTPTAVTGLEKVSTLAAGSSHTCAATPTGKLFCWGDNAHGQLGNNTTNDATTPTAVIGLS